MSGILLLAIRHLLANRVQAIILASCLAVAAFVPVASQALMVRYRQSLVERSAATPLVAGARGSRFDLALAALYFRHTPIETIPQQHYLDLAVQPEVLALPIHVGYTARGVPLVGTGIEYYPWRGLAAARGGLPVRMGEAVLGDAAARRLAVGPGDAIFTDQPELYDISKPPALRLHVCGVLAPTGTPDDDVIFVDIKTIWILGGFYHGHRDAGSVTERDLVIGRTEEHVAISGAMIEHNEVTPETIASYHVHGDPSRLPLTAVIIDPQTPKAGTILKTRINVAGELQAIEPRAVVDEILEFVVRIKALLDLLALVLGVCTALLGALVIGLSLRLRADEIAMLHRIGCSRFATLHLCLIEIAVVVVAALALAASAVAAVVALAPPL